MSRSMSTETESCCCRRCGRCCGRARVCKRVCMCVRVCVVVPNEPHPWGSLGTTTITRTRAYAHARLAGAFSETQAGQRVCRVMRSEHSFLWDHGDKCSKCSASSALKRRVFRRRTWERALPRLHSERGTPADTSATCVTRAISQKPPAAEADDRSQHIVSQLSFVGCRFFCLFFFFRFLLFVCCVCLSV